MNTRYSLTAEDANKLFEEKNMRIEMAELGAISVLKKFGIIKDSISQRQAYEIYGAAHIKSLVNKGLITRRQIGSGSNKVTYSRTEIDVINKLIEANRIKNS